MLATMLISIGLEPLANALAPVFGKWGSGGGDVERRRMNIADDIITRTQSVLSKRGSKAKFVLQSSELYL